MKTYTYRLTVGKKDYDKEFGNVVIRIKSF